MKPIQWGILSTAKIGRERVIPAMQQSELCDVVAIASRTPQRAREVGAAMGISRCFGTYAELLADPDVEAIYNPLPNDLHVEWSIRALNAGKHVLCEKPIACDAQAVPLLIDARDRTGLLVEEAFMVRDHPQWARVRELIDEGRIGTVRNVQLSYSHFTDDPNDIRNQAGPAGGSMLDVGCYCCAIARLIFDAEPLRALALPDHDPTFKIDRYTSAILAFPEGHASFFCSMQSSRYQMVQVVGTAGWMRIEVPFAHPENLAARLVIGRNIVPGTEPEETVAFLPVNQYRLQAERFSCQIRSNKPAKWPLETAVANMRVLDALRASGERGTWVDVKGVERR